MQLNELHAFFIFIRNHDFHVYYFLFTTIYDKTKKSIMRQLSDLKSKGSAKAAARILSQKHLTAIIVLPKNIVNRLEALEEGKR